jgi:hypothetical protein
MINPYIVFRTKTGRDNFIAVPSQLRLIDEITCGFTLPLFYSAYSMPTKNGKQQAGKIVNMRKLIFPDGVFNEFEYRHSKTELSVALSNALSLANYFISFLTNKKIQNYA